MTTYYVDSSFTGTSDGTETAPYNTLTQVNALTSPCNILFKRGSVFVGDLTINIDFTKSTESHIISCYGEGDLPVIYPSSLTGSPHSMKTLYNVSVSNISFCESILKFSPVSGRRLLIATLGSVNSESNVTFSGLEFNGSDAIDESEGFGFQVVVSDKTAKILYNNLLLSKCKFNGLANGFQAIGNSYQSDVTNGNWATDNSRCYNWRVEDCSFNQIIANDCLLCYVDSTTTDASSSSYSKTSGMFRCISNKQAYFDHNASVPLWIFQSWRTVFDGCSVYGTGGENSDHEGYDIDVGCSYCVIRNCIAANCSNGFALIIGEYKQVADRLNGTPSDPYKFFITNNGGNINNTIENCLSYNCGVAKEIYNYNDQRVLSFNGVQTGTVVKNFVAIDTMSRVTSVTDAYGTVNTTGYTSNGTIVMFNDGYYTSMITSYLTTMVTIQDSIFFYLQANSKRPFFSSGNNSGKARVYVNNSWFYSPYLGSSGSSVISPAANTTAGITVNRIYNTDPVICGLTFNSITNKNESKNLFLSRSSPCVGSSTSSTDVWWE